MNLTIIKPFVNGKELRNGDVKSGSFYTPIELAYNNIDRVGINQNEKIIEPSFGNGVFLFSIIYYAQLHFNLSNGDIKNWFINQVLAIDIDEKSVITVKNQLAKYFSDVLGVASISDDFSNVQQSDGLFVEGDFDLAIGNPPYINAKNIEDNYLAELRKRFVSCKNTRVDIYLAFMEYYISKSKRVSFIIPQGFTKNKLNEHFKALYYNKMKWIENHSSDLFVDASVFVMSFEYDRDHNSDLLKLYHNDSFSVKKFIDCFTNFRKRELANVTIDGDIVTLANSIYKVTKVGDLYEAIGGDNKTYTIEKGLVKKAIKATKAKFENGKIKIDDYIIFPYFEDGKEMPESYMKKEYPIAYSYFLSHKGKLQSRDKGKALKLNPFYQYARKQGIMIRKARYYIVFPKMIGGNSRPFVIDRKDVKGDFFIFSGYTLESNSPDLLSLFDDLYDFASEFCKEYKSKSGSYYGISPSVIKHYIKEKNIKEFDD